MAIFLFSFILYANTIRNSYNLDDDLVTNNHKLTSKGISAIPEIFSSTYYIDEMGYAYDYRPVVLSSFAIEHQLFGQSSRISHFINIILYALSNALIFIFLATLFSHANKIFILSVTLLFVTHPLHTEVVASIKNRDELLSLLFGLLSALTILKWNTKIPIFSYFIGVVFFTLGILSKPGIAPFAIIIPLIMAIFRMKKTLVILAVSFSLWTVVFLFSPLKYPLQYILYFILMVLFPLIFLIKKESIVDLFRLFVNKLLHLMRIKLYLLTIIKSSTHFFLKLKNRILNYAKSIKSIPGLMKEFYFNKEQVVEKNEVKEWDFYIFSSTSIFVFFFFYFLSILIIGFGIFSENYSITISGLVLLSLNYFLINDKVKRVYSFSYLLALLAISLKYNFLYSQPGIVVFALFIVTETFKHRTVNYLIYLACLILLILVFKDFDFLPLMIFIVMKVIESYIGINNKYYKMLLIVQALILMQFLILSVSAKNRFEFVDIINDSFGILIPALIFLLRTVQPTRKLIAPLFFTLILIHFNIEYTLTSPDKKNKSHTEEIGPLIGNWIDSGIDKSKNIYNTGIEQTQKIYEKANNTPGLRDRVLKQVDRPLNYVEYPFEINGSTNQRLCISSYALGEYIKLLIKPFPLSYYYGYAQVKLPECWNFWPLVSLLAHILIFIFALIILRNNTILGFGILYYLFSITVYSNFFYPIAGVIADRLVYIASLGFCICAVYIIFKILRIKISESETYKFRPSFLVIMLFILSIYSYQTIARNLDWKDHLTLFRNDIKHLDKSAQANYLLATRLVYEAFENKSTVKQTKMRTEAVYYYKKALEIYPPFFNAQYNLARTYSMLQDSTNALIEFKKTINLDSTFFDPYFQAALIYEQQGQINESIQYYELIISRFPMEIQAYNNLSLIYFRKKEYIKSLQINQIAIEKITNAYDPLLNIARIYIAIGDKTNALNYFERAYSINPNDIQLVFIIAELSKELGQQEKSEFYHNRVNSMRNGN